MARPPYVWDYDIDETEFGDILAGRKELGRLNRDWAAVRLLEHAPYPEIVRLLGYKALVEEWPRWRRLEADPVDRGPRSRPVRFRFEPAWRKPCPA